MSVQVIEKKNISVQIGEYKDQQTGMPKKQWRTIGEITLFENDQGERWESIKLWGPHGVTNGKIFPQDEQRASNMMNPPPPHKYAVPAQDTPQSQQDRAMQTMQAPPAQDAMQEQAQDNFPPDEEIPF